MSPRTFQTALVHTYVLYKQDVINGIKLDLISQNADERVSMVLQTAVRKNLQTNFSHVLTQILHYLSHLILYVVVLLFNALRPVVYDGISKSNRTESITM
jgi:hypothetical protein